MTNSRPDVSRRGSISAGRLVQLAIAAALGIVATLLPALVLAYWSWAWFAPRAAVPMPVMAGVGSAPVDADRLFGHPPGAAAAQASSGVAIRLVGVVAVAGSTDGYALLQLGTATPQLVRAGADVTAGLRLEAVLPDQVILSRGGARETLAWPAPGAPRTPPAAGATP